MSEKRQKDSDEKLELANKIAANSQKVAKTYSDVTNAIVYMFRRFTGWLNKLVFDSRFSKLAALLVAILIYIFVNADSSQSLNVTQASQINDIPIQVVYNSEIYEITGVPEKADVIVTGDMSDITLQKGQVNSKLICDLSGLTEGTYNIKLEPTNFISRLNVNVLETPTVTVTIKKKVTAKFNISYEFINTNRMDSIYSLGEPVFDQTEIRIRASQDTIDTIAFVKALIDVTDVTTSFTRTANVVAYNQQGEMVSCDIIPEVVTATVTVASPSKEVPIVVRPVGSLPDGLAIDSISLDYSYVTIYAPSNVLDTIDTYYIDLDVSGISKNTVVSKALTAPSGSNMISITKVNMEVVVGEAVSKVIADVPVSWYNNTSEYLFSTVNADDVNMNVLVTGTQKNIDALKVSDITVKFDVSNIVEGIQEVPLIVEGKNVYCTYVTEDGRTTVQIQVIKSN